MPRLAVHRDHAHADEREPQHHEVGGVRHLDHDPVAAPQPERLQAADQPVSGLVKIGIGQPRPIVDHRHPLTPMRGPFPQQLPERHTSPMTLVPVALRQLHRPGRPIVHDIGPLTHR
jgi:hypothetical protein